MGREERKGKEDGRETRQREKKIEDTLSLLSEGWRQKQRRKEKKEGNQDLYNKNCRKGKEEF